MKQIFTLLTLLLAVSTFCEAQIQFGNGSDGNLNVDVGETVLINTERTTVTGSNFMGSTKIFTDSAGAIQVGDEVLIITMTDGETTMEKNSVGQWETNTIVGIDANNFVLSSPLRNSFLSSKGKKHQIVKIPNYVLVDISGTLSCPSWDGSTGGILYFKSNDTVFVHSAGVITSSGKGYRGGNQYGASHGGGQGGESFVGLGGDGGHYTADPHGKDGAGGGGAAYNGYSGGNGIAGGGGGATGGTIGLGSSNFGGAGGGGGGHAGSAGGAGYGSFGFGGISYGSTNNGQDGGENFSGNGGTNGTGGGGGGGGTYGTPNLTKLYFGSGGGVGGRHGNYGVWGYGGNGGGLLFISANGINVKGSVLSNGTNGGNGGGRNGAGGGASGGSIVLNAMEFDLSGEVSSSGGTGGNGYYGNKAGDGGAGRIKITSLSTTNNGNITPEPYTTSIENIFHISLGNTSNTVNPYVVNAEIFDNENNPITAAKIHYRVNGGSFVEVNMSQNKSFYSFSGNIPAQPVSSTVEYYLTATDGIDNYLAPVNAPATLFSFEVNNFPPYEVVASDNNDGTLDVNWFQPMDLTNFVDYSIYRSEQDNFTPNAYNLLVANVSDTTYTDSTAQDFHTYYFIVSANYDYNGTSNEAFSDDSPGLLVNNTSQTTVLGYALLEGRNNHANIKIKFVPMSSSAVADSIYTNALGYFETHDIFPGIYTVLMSKDNFETPATWEQISIVEDLNMEESILYDYGNSVSGDVSGTWDGYVTVNGDITVPAGDSLIINPGTRVRFTGKYHMKVYGYLESNGSPADTVLFTVWPTQPHASNQWYGIDFYDLADDNSYVKYTQVEYAYDGIYYEWCRVNLEHVLIRSNHNYGIYMNRSDGSMINNSEFSQNTAHGIWMDYSTATFKDCLVKDNPSHGLSLYNTSYASISTCTFDANQYGVVANGNSNPLIDSCAFLNNTNDGVHFNTIVDRGSVTNCVFESNNVGIDLYYRSKPKINNNWFSQNNYGIEIQYDCDATISDNEIVDNSYGIVFNSSGYASEPVIMNNIIAYNENDGIHKNTNNSASSPTIINNTIFGNGRDGLHVLKAGTEVIRNNNIIENGRWGIYAGTAVDTFQNNNVYANASGAISNLNNMPQETWNFVSTNPNNNTSCDVHRNINEDPLFIFSDSLDLTLQIISKCIDGGTESLSDADGSISDIGALYFDKGNPHHIWATAYGDHQVSLAWQQVNKDSLLSYNVYFKPSGNDEYSLFANTSDTAIDVSGLVNNQLYDFTVSGMYQDYESVYAIPVSERPGIATIDYDPGSFSLVIPAADDSIIDNFSVTNNGSRDLSFNFPKSATNSSYVNFDGSGDLLGYGHADHLAGMEALTMECWLFRRNAGYFCFMGKNYRNYEFAINSGERVYFYKGHGNVSNTAYQGWETDQYITVNTWYHLALTWEGNTVKLYVNGELAWETNDAIDEPIPEAHHYSFDLGRRGGENSYYLNGKMSEARVWNKVRTAQEIKEYMNQSLRGNEEGLIGYWPLQEDFDDHSVYGLKATVSGNTYLETDERQVYTLYSVPEAGYTVAPGATQLVPLTFYQRTDMTSQFFTANVYSDDLNLPEIDLEVALQYGEDVPATPVHFIPVAETGLPYTIMVKDAKIDGQTIEVGDEIGVFDGDLCVGAGIFDGTFNFIITVWKENPGQGFVGFTPGNNMIFRLYDTSIDLETNEAEETYYIGDDTFGYGAFSALSLEASIYNIQNVSITGGQYNLISFNLLPHYPNATNVFGDMDDLEIVYNDNGGVFIPGYNINTIGDINFLDGFYILSNSSQTISYEGTFINVEDWNIAVEPSKWNYVAMIGRNPVAVTDVFTGLEDEISIVQAASGNTWIPDLGVNTIGNMQPGKGYKIALTVDTAITFNYPATSKNTSLAAKLHGNRNLKNSENAYFSYAETGLPYAVVVEIKTTVETPYSLLPGDEIALYDGETCVGSTVYQGEKQLLITAWRQDQSQGLPGFEPGKPIEAKTYLAAQQQAYRQKLLKPDGTLPTYNNGMYAHVLLQNLTQNQDPVFFNIAPNPFKSSTEIIIDLPREDMVDVNVFDASGRLIKSIVNGKLNAGRQQFRWNGTDLNGMMLNPGIYYIVAETSTSVITEKVIVLK